MPPVTQKLIAGIAVFVVILGGIGAGIYAKSNENEEIQVQVDEIAAKIKELDDVIATKETMKKRRDAQDEVFKELVSILPQYSERQDERIMEALTAYASVAKLSPLGLVPDPPQLPGAAAPGGPPGPGQQGGKDFAQTKLRIQYEGTFFNFLKFLNMVENHESFLRVDEISLTPKSVSEREPQPEHRPLNITIRVSTFHYVAK